ncbi:MAG: tRNA pseudouridine(55) synthase TruB [Piscirickettsiaceae bacterium CG_4_9_14_3_um_filter_43_564]|nr:tRNA pseudouridine(55) synthase TruB [Thiomicrospira sp.]OIP94309.1 MAG: tRNA pseudouridine(55) synthase TruB [Thiomicrospira sp. CG2_30_44_34]PIQ02561.1 MAG: tRNA pseudouridine(55) synthase TruB [Piscirickettsiaceae bacterium CG18_big_fil_WC_8_21_14_2_50_44_103]PIU39042.1 MAG: tRNA pseudouridine(55) synthase TruB [Piscirickettsiaceae bacterium CG07_land_8_20_14_0_80_44_28]PIW58176.1 MAG: tRNA pseudouridine(55) synthase TruB [Piscirickettsiaceae bacterium CG12_big_fil_rev_8_21_14_0_65_44_934
MGKKKWQSVNGLVLLNKPEGMTSNGVLQQVRRLYNAQKAGHTGALDPFATGLLPICLGEATKISGLLLDSDKRYLATLQLGAATDTGDKDGAIITQAPVAELSPTDIEAVLQDFLGEQTQVPPMYSALKHQGKPLYEYARAGIEIERPARPIRIDLLTLKSYSNHVIQFDVLCSKGTYVRTLAEDIAKSLGTLGYLTALHRIQTGSLKAEQMVMLADIETDLSGCLLPYDLPLQHLQALSLNGLETDKIQHGGKLAIERPQTDWVRLYDPDERFIGIGEWQVEKQLLKPKRLFNLDS